jgi:hypothetical protein
MKKGSILSYFLDYFTNLYEEDIILKDFKADFSDLPKDVFLDKYVPVELHEKSHDFSKHINWFNFEKVKEIARQIGFTEVLLSKKHQSVSEEMRSHEFDSKPGEWNLYIDIIK